MTKMKFKTVFTILLMSYFRSMGQTHDGELFKQFITYQFNSGKFINILNNESFNGSKYLASQIRCLYDEIVLLGILDTSVILTNLTHSIENYNGSVLFENNRFDGFKVIKCKQNKKYFRKNMRSWGKIDTRSQTEWNQANRTQLYNIITLSNPIEITDLYSIILVHQTLDGSNVLISFYLVENCESQMNFYFLGCGLIS